jgi:hypothetical protein
MRLPALSRDQKDPGTSYEFIFTVYGKKILNNELLPGHEWLPQAFSELNYFIAFSFALE